MQGAHKPGDCSRSPDPQSLWICVSDCDRRWGLRVWKKPFLSLVHLTSQNTRNARRRFSFIAISFFSVIKEGREEGRERGKEEREKERLF